jgi:hypothetical protein
MSNVAPQTGWSPWQPFPDPRRCGLLTAPFGPGCYELRRRDTGKLVLFGIGQCVAERMTSLLPPGLGAGTRRNSAKRAYVLEHLALIEYRTIACVDREKAAAIERDLKSRGHYVFPT